MNTMQFDVVDCDLNTVTASVNNEPIPALVVLNFGTATLTGPFVHGDFVRLEWSSHDGKVKRGRGQRFFDTAKAPETIETRRENKLRGKHYCLKCDKVCYDFFVVHDALWTSVLEKRAGWIHLSCFELLIGRKLVVSDFKEDVTGNNTLHHVARNMGWK